MNWKRCGFALALCLVLCLMVGVAVQPACAQVGKAAGAAGVDTGGGDKALASKQGMEALGGTKGKNDKKTATPTQMYIGVGSIFVMIAVVKWL